MKILSSSFLCKKKIGNGYLVMINYQIWNGKTSWKFLYSHVVHIDRTLASVSDTQFESGRGKDQHYAGRFVLLYYLYFFCFCVTYKIYT